MKKPYTPTTVRKLLTIKETAEILQIAVSTLRKMMKTDRCPKFFSMNNSERQPRYRFHEDDVYAFINMIRLEDSKAP